MFPIKENGKARRLCGEPTIFDAHGNRRAFCAKHAKEIEQFTKAKMREKLARSDKKYPGGHKMCIKKVVIDEVSSLR